MVFAGTGVWKSKRETPLLGRRCAFINDEQYGYNSEALAAGVITIVYPNGKTKKRDWIKYGHVTINLWCTFCDRVSIRFGLSWRCDSHDT